MSPTDPVTAADVSAALEQQLAQAEGRIARIEALFAGGPDTPCRTTWRGSGGFFAASIECVEVPMADLRAALAAALDGEPE